METNLTHIELIRRSWVSTQSVIDNAYHTMGSLDPSRYILYALCVDQLDSLLDLVLISHVSCLLSDQTLDNFLNRTLVTDKLLERNTWTSRNAYGQTLHI